MIKAKNPEIKSQINNRLARIEGQLRGVQKMITEDRDCKDIIQQLIAIRSAIQSASLQFLQDVASDCLIHTTPEDNPAAQSDLMAELVKMLSKVTG